MAAVNAAILVLAVVAIVLALILLDVWQGIVFLAAVLIALGLYGMVRA